MPTAIPVTPVSMNYASVVFMDFATISVIWYVIRGSKEFTGPSFPADVEPEHNGQVVGGLGRVMTDGEKTSHGSSSGENELKGPKQK
jgi:hypothetical protein